MSHAEAATNCRQVAREVQASASYGIKLSTDQQQAQNIVISAFRDALSKNPECRSELAILAQWDIASGAKTPFPFPESGDPHHYRFWVFSWWWNVILHSWLHSSVILMALFGWIIWWIPITIGFRIIFFLLEIGIGLLGMTIVSPVSLLRRRKTMNDSISTLSPLGLDLSANALKKRIDELKPVLFPSKSDFSEITVDYETHIHDATIFYKWATDWIQENPSPAPVYKRLNNANRTFALFLNNYFFFKPTELKQLAKAKELGPPFAGVGFEASLAARTYQFEFDFLYRVINRRISIVKGLEQDTYPVGDHALTKVICETLLIADDLDDHLTVDEQSWGDELRWFFSIFCISWFISGERKACKAFDLPTPNQLV
jgi:hypothetical protein